MKSPALTSSVLDNIGNTPLVRLTKIDKDLPVPIYAKCEHMNPGGSIKDRAAISIINDAEARGLIKPGDTLIEGTAGNTGMGIAMVAAARGYRFVCCMPETMSADKRLALATLGAELVLTKPGPLTSPDNFRNVAARLAEENGWFLTAQFANPANPRIHEQTTGPEILEQTGGNLSAFVAAAGTGGTITGVARALRAAKPDIKIILSDPVGSGLAGWVNDGAPTPNGPYSAEGVGSGTVPDTLDISLIDYALSIPDSESEAMTKRLVREEGLIVGGSSGINVAAAVRLAQTGEFNAPIVTVLPDSLDRYYSAAWVKAWL